MIFCSIVIKAHCIRKAIQCTWIAFRMAYTYICMFYNSSPEVLATADRSSSLPKYVKGRSHDTWSELKLARVTSVHDVFRMTVYTSLITLGEVNLISGDISLHAGFHCGVHFHFALISLLSYASALTISWYIPITHQRWSKVRSRYTIITLRCQHGKWQLFIYLFFLVNEKWNNIPHSLADPPTSWKYCCATFRCSLWNDRKIDNHRIR